MRGESRGLELLLLDELILILLLRLGIGICNKGTKAQDGDTFSLCSRHSRNLIMWFIELSVEFG